MRDDALERVDADEALADALVAVLVRSAGVLRVVDVHGAQAVKADHAVELVEHAVQVVHDVVAAVVDVARVQAYAHVVGKFHAVDDGGQLLERAADFRALTGHGLQQHRGGLLGAQHLVEQARYQLDARFCALLHVASRMEVVVVAGHGFHAHQVVCHAFERELAGVRLVRAGIERVGRMGHQRAEVVFGHQLAQRRGVGGVDGLRLAPAGVAREERERVRADGKRGFAHGQKALRR